MPSEEEDHGRSQEASIGPSEAPRYVQRMEGEAVHEAAKCESTDKRNLNSSETRQ